jgi:hypothetical protein
LLAVGVAALLIAAALFLKYAFDRGWIPPLVRSVGAVVFGIAVAAWGHDRIRRGGGMRRYGAAMIGAGGGLVYLGLWAAAGPYALMERRVGILLLAVTTIAVTYLAIHHEIEGLAIWALGGAYLAPVILATEPNPLGFLSYLEVIGLGTAITAYAMGWRATFNLAVFGYLVLAAAGASPAIATPLGCWLIAAGAILTLHITRQRYWPETRLGGLLIAWTILGTGLAGIAPVQASRWLALAAAVAVWGLLWWQQAQREPFTAEAMKGLKTEDVGAERLLFIMNPLALLLLASVVSVRLLNQSFELVPVTLAAAYLPVGWFRRSAAHLITGFLLVAFAMAVPWQATTIVIGWTGLALVALAAEGNAASRRASFGNDARDRGLDLPVHRCALREHALWKSAPVPGPLGCRAVRVRGRHRGPRALVGGGTRGQAVALELDPVRRGGFRGRLDSVPGLLWPHDGAGGRSRAECVVAAVRGGPRVPGLPAEPEARPLDGAGRGGVCGSEDCALRLVDDAGAVSGGILLCAGGHRARCRLRVQPQSQATRRGRLIALVA